MSITEACARIEANDPPITNVEIGCEMNDDGQWFSVGCYASDGSSREQDGYYDDRFDDVDVWRRFGKAIQGIDLERFGFISSDLDDDITPAAAACLDALFNQIKTARSINELLICLRPSTQVPMFDLRQFVGSNKNLKRLLIVSIDILSQGQVEILQESIEATQLEFLDMMGCPFANDGSLEHILPACNKVEYMRVSCDYNSHYSALSSLLQDPTNMLERLDVIERINNVDGPEQDDFVREVTTGLATNTKLKVLVLHRDDASALFNGSFRKLLCDPRSIENIYNSNHTLETLYPFGSDLLNGLLELNKNEDKTQVIRSKILKYYFIGDFDVAPFTNMPVSVVPEVINQITSDTKQSAIFRLLKCIPELSNMGNRNISSKQASQMKRRKIGVR